MLPQATPDKAGRTFFSNATGGYRPYSFQWSFGDGTSTVASQNATHTFAAWGIFNVTLTVRDASGARANASRTVGPTPPPCVSATPSGASPVYLVIGLGLVAALAIMMVLGAIRRRAM